MIQFRLAKRDKKGRMEFRGLDVPEATKIGSRQATVRDVGECFRCPICYKAVSLTQRCGCVRIFAYCNSNA